MQANEDLHCTNMGKGKALVFSQQTSIVPLTLAHSILGKMSEDDILNYFSYFHPK